MKSPFHPLTIIFLGITILTVVLLWRVGVDLEDKKREIRLLKEIVEKEKTQDSVIIKIQTSNGKAAVFFYGERRELLNGVTNVVLESMTGKISNLSLGGIIGRK